MRTHHLSQAGQAGPSEDRSVDDISVCPDCSSNRLGQSDAPSLDNSAAVYTDSGVSRVCVMEVEAVNSAAVGLQVSCLIPTHAVVLIVM